MPSERVQIRLHPKVIRETDALDVLHYFQRKGWGDRAIVREALIALGQAEHQGWQPEQLVGEGKVTAETIKLLREMMSMLKDISSMDFSKLPGGQSSGVDAAKLTGQMAAFQQGAAQLLGEAIFYNGDDD